MKRIILIAFLLSMSVLAMGARKAIVIGNAAYQDNPLRNPVNDARLIANVLRDLGFQVNTMLDADQETMDQGFDDFIAALDWQDEAVFYYSGHGVNTAGENYLIPTGRVIRDEPEIKYYAFSCNLALEKLQKARISVMILDACRDNPFKGARSGNKGLALMSGKAGSQYIIYSTELGKTAADGVESNSPFTTTLAKYIGSGEKITDMMQKVTREVKAITHDRQIPWTAGNLIEDFYFAKALKSPQTDKKTESAEGEAGMIPAFLIGKWKDFRGFYPGMEFIARDHSAVFRVSDEQEYADWDISKLEERSGVYWLTIRSSAVKDDYSFVIRHTHPRWISLYQVDKDTFEIPDEDEEHMELYNLGPNGETPPLKFEFPDYLYGEWFDEPNGSWSLSIKRTEWGIQIRYGQYIYFVRSVSKMGYSHWVFCEMLEDDEYIIFETEDYDVGLIRVTTKSEDNTLADSTLYHRRNPDEFEMRFRPADDLLGELEWWGWKNKGGSERIWIWGAENGTPARVNYSTEYRDSDHFCGLLGPDPYLIEKTEISGDLYRITAHEPQTRHRVYVFIKKTSRDKALFNITPELTDYPWGPYYEMDAYPIGG